MDLTTWKNAALAIGAGEDHFTMKRGSFRYNKKITWKRELTGPEIEPIEHGLRLKFTDPTNGKSYALCVKEEGALLSVDYEGSPDREVNRYWLSFPAESDEHIYGCGETYSKLDLKGERVRIWVAEHQNSNRIGKKIIKEKLFGKRPKKTLPFSAYESYYVQPTFVSSKKYFVHVNTDCYAEFDFSRAERTELYLEEPPHLFIGTAEDFPALSEKLSGLLGRQRRLPDWVYDGVILAIQEGPETIDRKLKSALDAGVKVNGVWSQDWSGCRRTGFGYQVMWNWVADKELYPNLKEKIAEWNEKGIRFLGYINPFLAIEKEIYQEAAEKGYCVKDPEGKDYLVTITTFPAAMIDLTNPEAYAWYKDLIKKNMIGIGMSGWMADFGEYLPVDAVLYNGVEAEKLHNVWPALWARLNKEAVAECGKEEEIFFFTRAGYTGTIKESPVMWTGDQHVDWSVDDGLPSVVPATLSLAMSGFCITHSDAGGYTTILHMRRSEELLLRWEEMNVYSPIWRSHEGNQPVNDVQFDASERALVHLKKCSEEHAALKEYLKACVEEAVRHGIPVMRPLFYHYEEEAAYTETTEYLLGRDYLVAPVLEEGATSRTVYLPADTWTHLPTGKTYTGGTYEIEAPIGAMPVFRRMAGEDA